MNRLYIPVLVALLIGNHALANEGQRLSNFRQFCVSDQGTGFNWRKGNWTRTNFVRSKFIVTKVDYPNSRQEAESNDTLGEYIGCTLQFLNENEATGNRYNTYNSCLKIQRLGEERPKYMPCLEHHFREGNSMNWKITFSCEYYGYEIFHMRPNGHFHIGTIHSNLESQPQGDYKDSLVIYVGECASIAD